LRIKPDFLKERKIFKGVEKKRRSQKRVNMIVKCFFSYLHQITVDVAVGGECEMTQEGQPVLQGLLQLQLVRLTHITVEGSITHCNRPGTPAL
jgi:hypothetical protein